MKRRFGPIGLAGVVLAVAFLATTGSASAETQTTLCEPEAPTKPVTSPNPKGECPSKYKTVKLPGPGELETLNKVLPHVKYEEKGVAGKPTIQFSGVNVQVVNGLGKTASVNGEGNLVIGYDETEVELGAFCKTPNQTGSHNLVLGIEQTFTSFGGIDAGRCDTISSEFASITGGGGNFARGPMSSVSGGDENIASGRLASVSGGGANTASSRDSSVSGGDFNKAAETAASVSGGYENKASGENAWVGGGETNEAVGPVASVSGGHSNEAKGVASSVSGGELNRALALESWIGGGLFNETTSGKGAFLSIFGGKEVKVTGVATAEACGGSPTIFC